MNRMICDKKAYFKRNKPFYIFIKHIDDYTLEV